MEYFQSIGSSPWWSDDLKITVKTGAISSGVNVNWSKCGRILSGPGALWTSKVVISCDTSAWVKEIGCISG